MKIVTYMTILIPIVISAVAIADRPHYNFSESVFEDLPPFPDDFWQVKHLFDTQQILASQLSKDYYQPELLPSWNSTCEQIYSSNKTYSYNGVFMYPSRFDIYNAKVNETITLSTLIYAHPGVRTYQGTVVYLVYNHKIVNATILTNNTYVLGYTYPKFNSSWMQLLEFKFTILDDTKDTIIEIKEKDPPYRLNQQLKDKYGRDMYSQCTSLLSEKISRCKVYIHASNPTTPYYSQESSTNMSATYVIAISALSLFMIALVRVLWKRKKRQKASM